MDTKPLKFIVLGALIGLAPTAYFYVSGGAPGHARTGEPAAVASRKILYYRNPMAATETSPVPRKAPDGMDYVPVYADDEADGGAGDGHGRVLYYRNPMGRPDTSPVPKKDAMGMDYLPVREGEGGDSGVVTVRISAEKLQKLGVRTEVVATRQLNRTVRAVGTIEVDESRRFVVAPKFEGWIEKLYVNKTGQSVARGEPLMEVYSPDLISAQQEYLLASQGAGTMAGSAEGRATLDQVIASSLQRLRNWNISDAEIRRLQEERKPRQYLPLRSPVSGVVLEKPSVAGRRFMAGESLFEIADLSTVWLLTDVFEQDVGIVHPGQRVKIAINAYPGVLYEGLVAFVYPTVSPETRTVKVRTELANPKGLLKPAMYGSIELTAALSADPVTVVPDSAVLDTGIRQVLLVQVGEGVFEPREVKLGARADGYAEVREGVATGEKVVVSANFLIDAESNLKAALGGFGHAAHASAPAQDSTEAPSKDAAQVPDSAGHHRIATGAGRVEAIDREHLTLTLAHDPITALKWPAMTMKFAVQNGALIDALRNGDRIEFDLADKGAGQFVITGLRPAAAADTMNDHGGH